jgi:ATP-binding cassette subfamily B protein
VEISQLGRDLKDFPQGLETQIGTRGVSISGGQKQRLSLARALVTRPKILILDDCTSALDSRTEAALWQQLEQVMPGRTVILITHRPDMLEKADMIFYLVDGRLFRAGRHHELISEEKHYAKLYKRYQLAQQVTSVT